MARAAVEILRWEYQHLCVLTPVSMVPIVQPFRWSQGPCGFYPLHLVRPTSRDEVIELTVMARL
jgi:hypothetical protein